jgi:hypothetical protein
MCLTLSEVICSSTNWQKWFFCLFKILQDRGLELFLNWFMPLYMSDIAICYKFIGLTFWILFLFLKCLLVSHVTVFELYALIWLEFCSPFHLCCFLCENFKCSLLNPIREIWWEGMDCIHLAEDWDVWWAVGNMQMNLGVPWNVGDFVIRWVTSSFSRRTIPWS